MVGFTSHSLMVHFARFTGSLRQCRCRTARQDGKNYAPGPRSQEGYFFPRLGWAAPGDAMPNGYIVEKELPLIGNIPFRDQCIEAAILFHRCDGRVEFFAQITI